jgi:hypothetical protein
MRKLSNIIVFIILLIFSVFISAQMPPKSGNGQKSSSAQRYFSPFKPKQNKEQKQKLQPNPNDLNKYAEFLRQSKTGLIRLYPDLECESAYILRADEVCAESIPGSSNYSFREREYTSDFLADIRLKSKFFVTDGVLTQSFLVSLGNVSLENLLINSEGMKFLTEFMPESENREAIKQYNQLSKGIKIGKYEYRKIVIVAENTTYAMRLIAYKANLFTIYRGWRYNVLEGDNRIDLTIGFRVVRKDEDGSITLLWKELDRKKSVSLKVSKSNEKNN